MTTIECRSLADLVQTKVQAGLKDMKFFLGNDDAGTEEVCQEVNRLYCAVASGRYVELDFGDLAWREDV